MNDLRFLNIHKNATVVSIASNSSKINNTFILSTTLVLLILPSPRMSQTKCLDWGRFEAHREHLEADPNKQVENLANAAALNY